MQMPVDFTAFIDEMTNVDKARSTELSLGVYIDSKAPADLVGHIRAVLASESPMVRMTLSYLDNTFVPREGDDIAIIVAGPSRTIGAAAAAIRAADVPVAVVTTSPATITRIAKGGKHAIPEGDIITPLEFDGELSSEEDEPVELTDELAEALDNRLGRWVVSVCPDKRLAFAIGFPFIRRSIAVDAVQATSLQNAGIGLVALIPGSDLPVMTLNQAKMLLQIAAAYGQPMSTERLKELLGIVGGAYLCRAIARQLVEFIPFIGFAVRAGVAYAGTSAMGHALIGYFEENMDVGGVAKVASNAVKETGQFVSDLREDPEAVAADVRLRAGRWGEAARDKIGEGVVLAGDLASEYAPKVQDVVSQYAPAARDAISTYAPAIKQAVSGAFSSVKSESASAGSR